VPPEVALVSPYPRLGVRHGGASGVASYTGNLAHALSDLGLRVAVVAPFEDGEPDVGDDDGVSVHRAFAPDRIDSVPTALAAARATGAPVVHVQHERFLYGGPPSVAGLLTSLAGRRRPRTVMTMHQVVDPRGVTAQFTAMHRIGVPPVVARPALRTLQRGLPRLVDATIVHESTFAAIVPGARVIPHGIEVVGDGGPEVRAAARERLGLTGDRLVVLCFGFLAPYKGLELALDAASLVADDVELVIAGGEHPRLVAQGDGYAEDLRGRYGDVARFTGYVPDDDVSPWFRAADLALFPYPAPHAASGALALALAHGTPSLLSPRLADAAGADPALRCPTTPVDLARRLRSLAADRSALEPLRTTAAALAGDRTWPAVAAAHASVYREVLDENPSPDRRRLRAA
jgi:glycosyltransferase involved in cell wall biosynthesis